MALHRDIHWIGRQWAVTGYGMQLIDQKLKGFFDIEASRLWEDGLVEIMHAKQWLNTADFDNALAIARARYPTPDRVTPPAEENVLSPPAIEPIAPLLQATRPEASKAEGDDPIAVMPKIAETRKPDPLTPKPAALSETAARFQVQFAGGAKFVRAWRVRVRQ